MKRTRRGTRNEYGGQKWIRNERRLAIYLRDGLACVWCSAAVEDGVQLTLDHVISYIDNGDNASENLVTACKRCNSSRGSRSIVVFAVAVAQYLNQGASAARIAQHVRARSARPVDLAAAKDLIGRRGTFTQALRAARSANG